jgi:hypothetical protein
MGRRIPAILILTKKLCLNHIKTILKAILQHIRRTFKFGRGHSNGLGTALLFAKGHLKI